MEKIATDTHPIVVKKILTLAEYASALRSVDFTMRNAHVPEWTECEMFLTAGR